MKQKVIVRELPELEAGRRRIRIVGVDATMYGPPGPPGDPGEPGESAQREARSDWVDPYSYVGIAAKGTAESASAWKVTRITVSGATVTTAQASPIKWSDRLTASYS